MTYSDATLKGFFDGTLSENETAAIEAALASDSALERRLMALDPHAAPVREAFEALPGKNRLDRLRPTVLPAQHATRRGGPWYRGGAIAASLALGVVLGSQFLPTLYPDAADWRLEVARYQALYVPETVAHIESDEEKLISELARASNALALDLPLEAIAEVDGLRLRRAQVLGFEGQPLIQLAYTDAKGTPFALCIMPGPNGAQGAETLAGLSTHAWVTTSHRFILVGEAGQADISRFADMFQARPLQDLQQL